VRILIFNWRDTQHPQAGGAETYLFELARRWVEWGHQVECITAGFPGSMRQVEIDGIRVTRVGNAVTVYALAALEYLTKFRERFDVIIDSENGIPFFSPLFSRPPKVLMMHHVHREVFRKHLPAIVAYPLMFVEARIMPLVYRRAKVVAVSTDTRNEMQRSGITRTPAEVVFSGVDPLLQPAEKSNVPTVLYLGRLKVYKRVDRIIESFVRVRGDVPNAILRIAGDGDARQALEALVSRLDLANCVIFEGFVDEDRKRQLLSHAWVFVSASEMEGWGISAMEANACGTPVVAHDVPGLREVVVDGKNGLLVPEGSDLAPAIVKLLTDDALRARLSDGAIERASEFSWDASARQMLDILRSIA
jgi:glycosyltransferase involved in cell wall biosynthesis